MPLESNKHILPEFEDIKENDEEILWTAKPEFKPFILSESGLGFPFIFIGYFFSPSLHAMINGGPGTIVMGFAFGYLFLMAGLKPLIISLLSFRHTAYAFSNKRVMIRNGVTGRNFKTIGYDKITEIKIEVDFFNDLYKKGSIKFYTERPRKNNEPSKLFGRVFNDCDMRWTAIADYENVFNRISQLLSDFKLAHNKYKENIEVPPTGITQKTKLRLKIFAGLFITMLILEYLFAETFYKNGGYFFSELGVIIVCMFWIVYSMKNTKEVYRIICFFSIFLSIPLFMMVRGGIQGDFLSNELKTNGVWAKSIVVTKSLQATSGRRQEEYWRYAAVFATDYHKYQYYILSEDTFHRDILGDTILIKYSKNYLDIFEITLPDLQHSTSNVSLLE